MAGGGQDSAPRVEAAAPWSPRSAPRTGVRVADTRASGFAVSDRLHQVEGDAPRIDTHADVRLPFAERADPVARHLAGSVPGEPGGAGIAEDHEVGIFDAEEPVQLAVIGVAHGVADPQLEPMAEFAPG